MAQQLHHPASETYFVIILLLLSYVMSSAPRYIREWRAVHEKSIPGKHVRRTDWKKALNAYTIQPYKNAWKQLQPHNVADLLQVAAHLPAQ